MRRIHLGLLVGVVASAWVSSIAIAQDIEEVTVTATRMVVQKPAGHTASGIPIIDISLSYGVSYAGLDLASGAGAIELEKRVNDAAGAACKEISRQRPIDQLTPNDAKCAKTAADKAMITVHELVAEARKKSAK